MTQWKVCRPACIKILLENILTHEYQSKLSLSDNTSPLDESSKSKLKLGLFSYPVLQAADILVHRYVISFFGTKVPEGRIREWRRNT